MTEKQKPTAPPPMHYELLENAPAPKRPVKRPAPAKGPVKP